MVGIMALLVAVGIVFQAVSTRRRRLEIGESYTRAGGMAYTGIQLGCAGILGLFGLALVVVVALNPST